MAKKKGLGKVTVTEFMTGRYGYDKLSRFLIVVSIVLMILAVFCGYNKYLYLIAIIILALGYGRMGSRNVKKRKRENEIYMAIASKFTFWKKDAPQPEGPAGVKRYATFIVTQEMDDDGTIYSVYKCRGCGEELRYPENQGIIKVICPVCKNELVDRT